MAPTSSENDVHFGEDVVFQILSWLPVISLLRFKSVCKSWKALIETTSFIDQHLAHYHRYLSPSTLIIVDPHMGKRFSPEDDQWVPSPLFLSFISGNEFQLPPEPFELDVPCLDHMVNGSVHMVTCNGIVCMHVEDDQMLNVLLWNPATKKLRTLPQSPFPLLHPLDNESDVTVGFGFDGKTNDYKVVRIINYVKYPDATRVELYSLRTDSWRVIDSTFHVDRVLSHPRAPSKNGIYCWFGGNLPDYEDKFIFSFDFTTEKFGTMSLPDGSNAFDYIAIVDDNIACMTDMYRSHFEIWVLYTFGVKESWTKIYMVENLARTSEMKLSKTVGLSRNGRFLLFVNPDDGDLCMYDLVTLNIKNLELNHQEEIEEFVSYFNPHCATVAENKESLALLESGYGASDNPHQQDHGRSYF